MFQFNQSFQSVCRLLFLIRTFYILQNGAKNGARNCNPPSGCFSTRKKLMEAHRERRNIRKKITWAAARAKGKRTREEDVNEDLLIWGYCGLVMVGLGKSMFDWVQGGILSLVIGDPIMAWPLHSILDMCHLAIGCGRRLLHLRLSRLLQPVVGLLASII